MKCLVKNGQYFYSYFFRILFVFFIEHDKQDGWRLFDERWYNDAPYQLDICLMLVCSRYWGGSV